MVDEQRSIFNEQARERLRSPDDLDKYVQVTNPNVWTLLIASVAMVLGLLCWGAFGSVSTSVSATSVKIDDKTLCFLDTKDVASVKVGNVANVGGHLMKVSHIASVPSSRQEAHDILGSDFLASELLTQDWGYLVVFEDSVSVRNDEEELPKNTPLETTITTERMAPLSLVFGKKS